MSAQPFTPPPPGAGPPPGAAGPAPGGPGAFSGPAPQMSKLPMQARSLMDKIAQAPISEAGLALRAIAMGLQNLLTERPDIAQAIGGPGAQGPPSVTPEGPVARQQPGTPEVREQAPPPGAQPF